MGRSSVLTTPLLQAVRGQYRLRWEGIHGLALGPRADDRAPSGGAYEGDPVVVELFAVFHDACRTNEDRDAHHGRRGAELAASLRGHIFDLPDTPFALLIAACADHTDGNTEADITVQTCWDADRLDLGRVGIPTDRARLCTPAAKDPRLFTGRPACTCGRKRWTSHA